jgi:hypothetical protein
MKHNNQIDIPLIFFACAFFIVIIGLFIKLSTQSNISHTKQQLNLITLAPQQKKVKLLKKLDYNLPIECEYITKDSSMSATISQDSVSVMIKSGDGALRYLVQGDCLYTWNINTHEGVKKCGVGGYVSMGRQLLSSGIGSIDSIISMFQKSQAASQINIEEALNSCKNAKEIRKEVFVLPKNVRFE